MSNLTIQRVSTARQKKQFLQFPWTLYRDDPNWIPPLRGNQKELVGYKPHPFYARNAVQTFLAYRGDEVRGRIAAILNEGHINQYDDPRGFFGFFDCCDDQEAADGLFDAVRRWFADQGIYRLRGPTNPSQNYELGLLIEGFDSPPTFMMTYNPPYYERLVEHYGFRKTQDLYAFWGEIDMLPKIQAKLGPIAEQIMERFDVKLRTLDTSRFREDVEMFLSIYNRSLVNTWGFVPMSADEIEHMAQGLRQIIVPEMAIAAEIDGRVVGASFGLPDYNPRIKEIDGRLFPFGFIRLLRNRRAIKRIRLISTNVLPEYQRMGVGMVLLHGLVPKALEWGIREAEFSWVLESNSLSFGSLKKGGAKIAKTYRLYDWEGPEVGGQRSAAGDQKSEIDQGSKVEDQKPEGWPLQRPLEHPLAPASLPPLEIRAVRGRGDLDRFLKLPWRIYADDPHWVPPLKFEVREFLDRRKHPFYKHGEAVQFIALRGGECVGRVLVSDDPNYNRQHSSNAGCFGMFECLDDLAAAHALLDAAAGWLAARGRTTILRTDRLLDELPLRLADRRFRHAAADHDEPQPAVLRRVARIVGAAEGHGPLRLVVPRSARSGRAVAGTGGKDRPPQRRGDSPLPPRRFCGRSDPLPGNLQCRNGRPVGVRQTHRGRVPLSRQTAEADGGCGSGVDRRDRRPGGRIFHHPARPQRGDRTVGRPVVAAGMAAVHARQAADQDGADGRARRVEGISPPRRGRNADPADAGLRQKRPRLHRRRTELDLRGQRSGEPPDPGRRGAKVQDVPDLRERNRRRTGCQPVP